MIIKFQAVKNQSESAKNMTTDILTSNQGLETKLKPVFNKLSEIKSTVVTKLSYFQNQNEMITYQEDLSDLCSFCEDATKYDGDVLKKELDSNFEACRTHCYDYDYSINKTYCNFWSWGE